MAMAAHRRVAVVVLGDLARSPRMQYHAQALAGDGVEVDLVGYGRLECEDDPRIAVHSLRAPRWLQSAQWPKPMFVLIALLRVAHQALQLWWTLRRRLPRYQTLLVQVPPSLPTLLVAQQVAAGRGARLIIDWHNFGYAMLALRLGEHPMPRLMRRLERACARRASANLCVSESMQRQLAEDWGVAATVLHDHPARLLSPLDLQSKAALFEKYAALLPGYAVRDPRRPALLISPTSWTADEDFDCLCDAAVEYDARAAAGGELPRLLLLITGQGERRAHYEAIFARLQLRHVQWSTGWLPQHDYAPFLSSADLGVSLHRSASKVDLPMKVADMIGAGLPVCMLDYGPCVREMIDEDRSGVFFRDATELAARWAELLRGFPQQVPRLAAMRAEILRHRGPSWESSWRATARPLFL
jgi:beta-1,4-mannosyltransferase